MAGEKGSALGSINRLRTLCGFPMLVDGIVGNGLPAELDRLGAESVIQQSAKLQVLLHMVKGLICENHRTLIFSQSTRMLTIIQFVLRSEIGDRIARIDGATKEQNRQLYVDMFNADDSQFDVMLLSTKAGT